MRQKYKIIFMSTCVTLLLSFVLAFCWSIHSKRIFDSILAFIDFLLVAVCQWLILSITNVFEAKDAIGRLKIERKDLLIRYKSLDVVIHNQAFMESLTIEMRELLIDQADSMKVYLSILTKRLQIMEDQEKIKRK